MLVQVDASQIEWRTILQLSQDSIGIEEVLNKEDVHSKNEKAFELPSRLIAKIYLFRTIFRGSGWSFANDPDFMHVSSDPRFWDDLNVKFFTKYKGIDTCHKRWAEEIVQGRPIVGPLGRSWSIGMKPGFKIPWTTLTNYPTQGTAADVMMFARISAYKRIKDVDIMADFISTVHDSIIVDTISDNVQAIVDIFHSVFADIPNNIKSVFDYDWNVPMDCECKMGMNMKEMKKIQPSWA